MPGAHSWQGRRHEPSQATGRGACMSGLVALAARERNEFAQREILGDVQGPSEVVVAELARRAQSQLLGAPFPSGRGLPGPKRLEAPDMKSVRVLSERRAGDRCAVALTVEDRSGERYQVIRVLVREDGAWRFGRGFEGPERTLPGKPDPYVSLGAYPGSKFFAGGTVQSAEFDVARVRLVWDDGQVLEDQVENGVVLFFGSRESLDPATAEFLDRDGRLIGTHVTLIDEQDPPAVHRAPGYAGPLEITWQQLNELTHVAAVDGGAIAGVLYTVPASSAGHDRWDLCWLSSESLGETHVLFGASEQRGDAWATRWDRAHRMVDGFLRKAPRGPVSYS